MLPLALAAVAFVMPTSQHSSNTGLRITAPTPGLRMAAQKKVVTFDENGVFEGREVSLQTQPVYLLTRLEELGALTFVSELGLFSKAEELGVFSKLEQAGAFSKVESILPVVDKLGLLTFLETALDVEAGLQFTIANFLIVFTPTLITLQICGFVGIPNEPIKTALELIVCGGTFAVGAALFVLAYGVSLLQGDTR